MERDPLGDEEATHNRPVRIRLVNASAAMGTRWSPGSTSSSDTADMRDFAEAGLSTVDLNEVNNGSRPQYRQGDEGNFIDYDPETTERYTGESTPGSARELGYTTSVLMHESTHAGVAMAFDNRLGDFTNMNLPPEDDPAFQESAARQMEAITSNMETVGWLATHDAKLSRRTRQIVGQPYQEGVNENATGAVGYSQSLPHGEYVSVIAELKNEIRQRDRRTYKDSPTYRYLTDLNKQAREARTSGGEIQKVTAEPNYAALTAEGQRALGGPSNSQGSSRSGGRGRGRSGR